MEIGTAIKNIRRAQKISQETLSRRAGISKSYLCLIETNTRLPTLRTVELIAKGLKVSYVKFYLYMIKAEVREEEQMIHDILDLLTNYI